MKKSMWKLWVGINWFQDRWEKTRGWKVHWNYKLTEREVSAKRERGVKQKNHNWSMISRMRWKEHDEERIQREMCHDYINITQLRGRKWKRLIKDEHGWEAKRERERGWEGLNAVITKRRELPCLFTARDKRGCAVAHTIILGRVDPA